MLSTILIAIAIILLMYMHIKKRELDINLPYSKYLHNLPFSGSTYQFIFNQYETLGKFYLSTPQETPYKYRIFTKTFVYVQRVEDFQAILSTSKALRKSSIYNFLKGFLGNGLLTAPVTLWKKNRKLIDPVFNQKNLDLFVESFSEGSIIFTNIIEKFKGQTIDLNAYVFRYTLEVLLKNGMDLSINIQTEDHKMAAIFEKSRDIIMERMLNLLHLSDFFFGFTQNCKTLEDHTQYYKKFYSQVLEDKKTKNLEENFNENSPCNILLDRLIWLEMFTDKITDKETLDELKTFIIAGTDTTTISICFTLIMLAMHKDIEDKVYKEVIEVLGHEKPVEIIDIPKFVYLEKVIKETLRLFPVGPLVPREVTDDIQLDSCTLKKGCALIFGVGPAMRSAEYYPDPLKFDPERFNPEEVKKRHPYAFIPFFAGPRNCIGKNYAMMSMKTLLATSIRKFKFETDYKKIEDIKFTVSILIKPFRGYPIRAILRNEKTSEEIQGRNP